MPRGCPQNGAVLPLPWLLRLYTQLLVAVEFLHEARVLHRDLTTQNVRAPTNYPKLR